MTLEMKCTQIVMNEDCTIVKLSASGDELQIRIPKAVSVDFAPGDKVFTHITRDQEAWN